MRRHTNWTHRRRDRRGDRRGVELRGLGDAGLARAVTVPCADSVADCRLAALAALTLLRLAVAAIAPLAPDEAYYWVWSRALAAGYPDHPPMVALWVRVGTHAGRRRRRWASGCWARCRWRSPRCCWRTPADRLLPGRRAGAARRGTAECDAAVRRRRRADDARHAAAGLLDSLPVGAGAAAAQRQPALVAGDRPVRRPGDGQQVHRRTALARHRPLAAGHAVGARPGCGGPRPGSARCSALAVFLPVVLWEAGHDWVSFARQGGRIARLARRRSAVRFLGELIGGQVGLVTPLVFAVLRRRCRRGRAPGLADPRSGVDAAGRADACPPWRCSRSTRSATGCRATGPRSSIPPPRSPPPVCGRRSGTA